MQLQSIPWNLTNSVYTSCSCIPLFHGLFCCFLTCLSGCSFGMDGSFLPQPRIRHCCHCLSLPPFGNRANYQLTNIPYTVLMMSGHVPQNALSSIAIFQGCQESLVLAIYTYFWLCHYCAYTIMHQYNIYLCVITCAFYMSAGFYDFFIIHYHVLCFSAIM